MMIGLRAGKTGTRANQKDEYDYFRQCLEPYHNLSFFVRRGVWRIKIIDSGDWLTQRLLEANCSPQVSRFIPNGRIEGILLIQDGLDRFRNRLCRTMTK
ncbi:MAG: hypothetical protein P8X46_13920 [Nitrospirales bacterium]